METMTRKDWLAKGQQLFGPDWKDWVFVCPICKTNQTARQIMETSGCSEEKVQEYLGFSCIGRFNAAGEFDPKRKDRKFGCNWTLGGFLHLHTLEVTYKDDDGPEQIRPMFEFYDPGVCGKLNEGGQCGLPPKHVGRCVGVKMGKK